MTTEYDEQADAIGSYYAAIKAIGARVKAGEPMPAFFVATDRPVNGSEGSNTDPYPPRISLATQLNMTA